MYCKFFSENIGLKQKLTKITNLWHEARVKKNISRLYVTMDQWLFLESVQVLKTPKDKFIFIKYSNIINVTAKIPINAVLHFLT